MSDFVTVQDVTFGYGRRVILDDVTLHFGRGQVVAIMGGSGMGKTTLLNVLSSFIPKEERIITIEDNAELQIQGAENLVRLEARQANTEGKNSVTIL